MEILSLLDNYFYIKGINIKLVLREHQTWYPVN
jgi:hypothetical protein